MGNKTPTYRPLRRIPLTETSDYKHRHAPSTSRRSRASFVVHGRLCRDPRKMEFQVVKRQQWFQRKGGNTQKHSPLWHPGCAETRDVYAQYRTANVQFARDAGLFCIGQVGAQLGLLSAERSSLQAQSLWLICSPRTSALTLPLSWLTLLRLLLWN